MRRLWHRTACVTLVVLTLVYAVTTVCAYVIAPVWGEDVRAAAARMCVALVLAAAVAWSFARTALTSSAYDGRSVPPGSDGAHTCHTVKMSTGTRRWCAKCCAPKPDRCHHCSSCGTCVLRMDHHCPWIMDQCIGLRNYKFFVLLLWYAGALSVYILATVAEAFLHLLGRDDPMDAALPFSWIALFALSLVLSLTLVPFGIFHFYLLCTNRTTLEYMEGTSRVRIGDAPPPAAPGDEASASRHHLARLLRRSLQGTRDESSDDAPLSSDVPDADTPLLAPTHLTAAQRRHFTGLASRVNLYNVGLLANLEQAFGRPVYLWLLPVGRPHCDGIQYPVNEAAWCALQRALDVHDVEG
ncbi:protein S-acyltransferase [Malassezia sp. CBS 17886]|nr:protein S-acyltransferase [Malassezia sp. CBS 17886]